MEKLIYADNAATTPILPAALEAYRKTALEAWGNPSSLYTLGQKAKEVLEKAREEIAACIGASPREIIFTSGGSEADNQALRTGAYLGKRKGKTEILSTAFEHHAILHTLEDLGKEGFTVKLLPVGKKGVVEPKVLAEAISENTALVSVMTVNNEIGTVQPIAELAKICREKGVLFHTDAVQAVGHMEVDVKAWGVDMLSASAHKFRGPRGIGFLYARRGLVLKPVIFGGAQERNKRAGTENLAAIAGMSVALREAVSNLGKDREKMISLRERLIAGLQEIPYSCLNGDREKRNAGTVNFCFEGIEGESLLLLLDEKGVCASSGSACTSGSLDPSHVLLAIGLPAEVAHGSLRLSLSAENTEEEVDAIVAAVKDAVAFLRSISPLWESLETGKKEHWLKK